MKKYLLIVLLLLSFGKVFANSQDYELIKRAYGDKLYLFVEERAQKYLKDSQNNDLSGVEAQKIRYWLIGSYVHRGFYKNALIEITNFEKDFSKSNIQHLITFLKAKCLYKKYVENGENEYFVINKVERPAELIKSCLSKLLNDQSIHAEALYIQGKDLYHNEQYLSALNVLKKLTNRYKNFKNYEDSLFYLGRSYYHNEVPMYENALKIFSQLINKNQRSSNLAEYYFWRGECYYEMNKVEKALDSFSTALLSKPNKSLECDIYYNLGWLYAGLGEIERAKSSFSKLLSKDLINYSKIYFASTKYKLASLYMIQKEYKKSLIELRDIIDHEETKFEAALLSGQVYMHLNSWDNAEHFLTIASSDNVVKEIELEAKKNLSTVYYEKGNFEDAMKVLNGLIATQVPLDYRIDIQLQKAEILFGSGKIYEAQSIYRELLLEEDESLASGLHYKLALCAMKTNPLVECFYEREKLLSLKDKTENKADLDVLYEKLGRVLIYFWVEASKPNPETILNKKAIIDGLNSFVEEDITELKKKQEEEFIDKNKSFSGGNIIIPSEIHKDSMVFNALKEKFVEGFKKNKYGNYKEFSKKAPLLSRYYRSLQIVNILNHLEFIIRGGLESPFLSLAYFEKAMLNKSQKFIEKAIENFKLAIESTADDEAKSNYLFHLVDTRLEDAKLERENKQKTLKIRKTLNAINELDKLNYISKDDIAYYRFTCYTEIQEYNSAAVTLEQYLNTATDQDAMNVIQGHLISHYFKINQNLKAADQYMSYANRLQKVEGSEEKVIRLKYKAAELYIENADTFEKGSKLMLELANGELTKWSFKALIKSFQIFKKKGDQKEIDKIMTRLDNIGMKDIQLQCEKEFLLGEYFLYIQDSKKAFEKFKWVIDKADAKSEIRAKAYFEYASILKVSDPKKASKAFLDFYYLFPNSSLKQKALFQCCRLMVKSFKMSESGSDEMKIEIKKLIAKLNDNEEQKKLLLYLEN
jgi:tetratricopeptide (TPR) repeat protein